MIPIYGCSTDMGSILSSGQGEAAAATVVVAAASFGPDESAVGCRACRCRRVVSLKCAGWLPQDRGFESELAACLGSSVNTSQGNGFAHRTDADHSKTLTDTFCLPIWTVVGC